MKKKKRVIHEVYNKALTNTVINQIQPSLVAFTEFPE